MLQELLQAEMQKLTGIIKKKDDYIKLKSELEEKVAGLKNEVEVIYSQLDEMWEQKKNASYRTTCTPYKKYF